ncbi:hypothetical protein O1611_g5986 [Lasiodiplodia mahajangana]|uniref:Uncharacterized protein n=1 Tax=Lasiodiplodia mahajangana TaxID=1108764 RepID=A0ACC2JK38_9PEZI|nr:hypothetical protein O1611_g5986 [Lasiodiplodia mahajangana]
MSPGDPVAGSRRRLPTVTNAISNEENGPDWNEHNQRATSRPHLFSVPSRPTGSPTRAPPAATQMRFPANMTAHRILGSLELIYPDTSSDATWTVPSMDVEAEGLENNGRELPTDSQAPKFPTGPNRNRHTVDCAAFGI